MEETNNIKTFQFIEEVTANANEVQKRVLVEILSANPGVEYLKRRGLDGNINRETFKKTMPITKYEDIHADINRVSLKSYICSPIS